LSKAIKDRAAEKKPNTADRETSTLRKSPYINSSYATSSEVTLGPSDTDSANAKSNQQPFSAEWSTVNLVGDARPGDDRMRHSQRRSDSSTVASRNTQEMPQRTRETLLADPEEEVLEPELSWTMTLLLLTAVTIVSL
jgi:hypothetical protein